MFPANDGVEASGSLTDKDNGHMHSIAWLKGNALRSRGFLLPQLYKLAVAIELVYHSQKGEYDKRLRDGMMVEGHLTEDFRLDAGSKMPFLRQPLNHVVLRDWITEGEALRAKVITSDLQMLRLQMLENEIWRDQEKATLSEIRDLLKDLNKTRTSSIDPAPMATDRDSTHSPNTASKHDSSPVVEDDIRLQRSHNLDSHAANTDIPGPVNDTLAVDPIHSTRDSIPVTAEEI